MTSKINSRIALCVASIVVLNGCSTFTSKTDVRDQHALTQDKISAMTAQATDRVLNSRENAQDVQAPWIAGKSVPLAKEVSVPAPLRRNVRTTILSPACVSATVLTTVAACITEATGVAVRVKPEALLPISMFAPRTGSSVPGAPMAPVTNASVASPAVFSPQATDIPLVRLLDTIAATYGVSYKLANDGALEFYRLDAQTFRIKALTQKLSAKLSQITGFDANSTTSFEIKDSDALESIRKTVLSIGTVAGTVTVSPETQALIVSDTPESLERVSQYLEAENKRLTRRVTLVMDQFYVNSKNDSEFSLDWNLIYGALASGTGTGDRGLLSPASLASNISGALSMTQLTGKFAGTKLLVNALNEQGLLVQHRSFPLSTQNGVPVSLGLPTIFDYVQEVTFTPIGTGNTTVAAPTVKQKEERIGTYLTVTPEAQDDGQVIISVNFQDRTGTLTPFTVSAGGFSSTIQQRNIDELSNMARTVVRVGVPTVIGGMSEVVDASRGRRLDDLAPLVFGGSDAVKRSKRSMILVVTAIAEDGV
jgi:hypothetical protein